MVTCCIEPSPEASTERNQAVAQLHSGCAWAGEVMGSAELVPRSTTWVIRAPTFRTSVGARSAGRAWARRRRMTMAFRRALERVLRSEVDAP